jgi:23S rRNA-/tRNA-specific pseudouridylate synthase
MDLKILFEDKHVIVVIKPPGMPCQPDPSGGI